MILSPLTSLTCKLSTWMKTAWSISCIPVHWQQARTIIIQCIMVRWSRQQTKKSKDSASLKSTALSDELIFPREQKPSRQSGLSDVSSYLMVWWSASGKLASVHMEDSWSMVSTTGKLMCQWSVGAQCTWSWFCHWLLICEAGKLTTYRHIHKWTLTVIFIWKCQLVSGGRVAHMLPYCSTEYQ